MHKNKLQLCPLCKKSWDRCKCDLEKDFGVRIGNKEQAAWQKIHDDSTELISQNKRSIEIHEVIVEHAKKRMEEEKQKGIGNA